MFLTGGPGKPIGLGESIQKAVQSSTNPCQVRIGFAYATKSGIASLCEDESGNDWRDDASCEWLIGIDQGITEPDALRNLTDHTNSEVRVLVPGGDLSRNALYRRPRFHAKIALIESINGEAANLITTSANMTASALEDKPTNYEVGMMQSRSDGLTDDDLDAFDEWWESAWNRSQPVTSDFIDEYADLRDDYLEKNPDIREFESSGSVNHASEADHLWRETGKMTGGSRNQIEFSTELSPFIDTKRGKITVIVNGETYTDCSVSPRVTDPPFGQDITPVYLPTDYDYAYRYVHLERLSDGPSGDPRYELTIADSEDDIVDEWRRRAEQDGVHGNTGGGYEYGYY